MLEKVNFVMNYPPKQWYSFYGEKCIYINVRLQHYFLVAVCGCRKFRASQSKFIFFKLILLSTPWVELFIVYNHSKLLLDLQRERYENRHFSDVINILHFFIDKMLLKKVNKSVFRFFRCLPIRISFRKYWVVYIRFTIYW